MVSRGAPNPCFVATMGAYRNAQRTRCSSFLCTPQGYLHKLDRSRRRCLLRPSSAYPLWILGRSAPRRSADVHGGRVALRKRPAGSGASLDRATLSVPVPDAPSPPWAGEDEVPWRAVFSEGSSVGGWQYSWRCACAGSESRCGLATPTTSCDQVALEGPRADVRPRRRS